MSNNNSHSMDIGLNTSNTNSMIEDPTDVTELEDIVMTLMENCGLLSKLKGEVGKFIQENGNIKSDQAMIQSRGDPVILQSIYEYLQWIGMKQTSAVLLSESVITIKINTSSATIGEEEPELCQYFNKFSSISAVTPSHFQQQFDSPIALQKGFNNSTSINFGNRTYTANTDPSQQSPVSKNSGTIFGRSVNSTKSASFYSAGEITSYFSANEDGETVLAEDIDIGRSNPVQRKNDLVKIVKLQEHKQVAPSAAAEESNAVGDNVEDEDSELLPARSRMRKEVLFDSRSDGDESSLSSESEPVDSPPPRTEAFGDSESQSKSKKSLTIPEAKEKDEDYRSRTPTFLSPSDSTSSERSEPLSRQNHNSQKSLGTKGKTQESGKSESVCDKKQSENGEEDTCDESVSDLLSLSVDNNTQDISLAGSTSADLLSCEHIVQL